MNYRHLYHAGSFTDTCKHIVLIALAQALLRKETPFCYLDTHAGIGCYDLFSAATQKSQEFMQGVQKIWQATHYPALIQDYLTCIKTLNSSAELRYYPGSPYFIKQLLRSHDRMVLTELHPDDAKTLKQVFRSDKRIAIHQQDGYQSLKAFLPPKERRGLILIDPAYEQTAELTQALDHLSEALKRFATGIYALWYPIKQHTQLTHFYRQAKLKIPQPQLAIEFCIYDPDVATQLNGCGILIINPPWQLEATLEPSLAWLHAKLRYQNQGHYSINPC